MYPSHPKVASQASTSNGNLNYDAPTLAAVSPTTATTSGGSTLTLTGTSFGATGALVSVGNLNCPVTFQNHTLVACTLPAGVGQSLSVTLTAAGQASNAKSFSYSAPIITSLSPASGPTQGGQIMTIFGTSLGNSQGAVTFGGFPCDGTKCTLISQNHTQIAITYVGWLVGLFVLT